MANDNYGDYRNDGVNLVFTEGLGFEATKGAGADVTITRSAAGQLTINGVLAFSGTKRVIVPITANGAVNPHLSADYVFTKAGVAAMTLAAPTVGTDDGVTIVFTNTTTDQDTVTATGLFQDGSTHVNLATWPAQIGASLTIRAYNGKWQVIANNNVTLS